MIFEIRVDLGLIAGVFLGLVLFGIACNALVTWLERKGYTEGFLSLIVAGGVFVTLCILSILSIQAALLALLAFVASGTPMIIGSILRYLKARNQAREEIARLNARMDRYADKSARVAE